VSSKTQREDKSPQTEDCFCLTTKKIAVQTQTSTSYWEKLRGKGGGPKYVKVGRSVRYRPDDIRDFMNSQVRASTSSLSSSKIDLDGAK